MDARQYLSEIKNKNHHIKNKINLIAQLREEAQLPRNVMLKFDKVQMSKQDDSLGNGVCNYLELEEQLNEEISDAIRYKQEVIHTIEKLKCVEYDFLFKRYVLGLTCQEVADSYERSYSWATTVHGRAIKSLQKILDEGEK